MALRLLFIIRGRLADTHLQVIVLWSKTRLLARLFSHCLLSPQPNSEAWRREGMNAVQILQKALNAHMFCCVLMNGVNKGKWLCHLLEPESSFSEEACECEVATWCQHLSQESSQQSHTSYRSSQDLLTKWRLLRRHDCWCDSSQR